MMIRRLNINNRIDRYGSLLSAIEEGHDLHADESQLQLSDQEKSETLAALDGDLYLVTRIRRPVLLRLPGHGSPRRRHVQIPVSAPQLAV
jgi:hypothetical protein